MKIVDQELLDKIPSIFKNKIFYILFIYFIYLLFFNQYNLFSQSKLFKDLRELKKEEVIYTDMISDIKEEQKEIFKNKSTLEQFAREKYWMKRDSEDVYIFVKKD
ncbi:MAG: septum formation initiator family protein [Sphingobacteriales bacterium]|nr:MAG: septum formation initiator family protein [Sphingobacteriales bacterium]